MTPYARLALATVLMIGGGAALWFAWSWGHGLLGVVGLFAWTWGNNMNLRMALKG